MVNFKTMQMMHKVQNNLLPDCILRLIETRESQCELRGLRVFQRPTVRTNVFLVRNRLPASGAHLLPVLPVPLWGWKGQRDDSEGLPSSMELQSLAWLGDRGRGGGGGCQRLPRFTRHTFRTS